MTELAPMTIATRLAIAALLGLAVGVEREWSGSTSGPNRRFAGLRTFLMFGLTGGIAGLLIASGQGTPAAMLIAGSGAFIVAAYVMATRRASGPLDGTTEGAAFVVLGLAVLAGLGYLGVAAGSVALVVFALGEKEKLHWLVRRIGETEMHATLQFLVLALVILPLLPAGPLNSLWGIRPRALWTVVVVLSGLNFAGYLARRAIGSSRGYSLTGLLGGIVSSTAVTLQFARLSRNDPERSAALSAGVVAACSVVPIRVAIVCAVMNPALARALDPYLIPMLLVGVGVVVTALRHPPAPADDAPETRSPLRLGSALQMALVFQVAFLLVSYAQSTWGSTGIISTGVLVGIADADALALAMSRAASGGADRVAAAAQAMAAGVLATTLFKALLAALIGAPVFRRRTVSALLAMSVAFGALAWWGLFR